MGASANHVKWLVLRQSMSMVMAGVLLGTAAALAAARMLEHLVPGVRSAEPVAFGAMTLVLLLAAFLVSFIPAYRAGKVEPMRALRQD